MIKKYIFRALFCLFRYLPSSQNIIFGRLSKSLRAFTAKGFIKKCGKNVNIEHGAEISSKLSIGDNSGVGIDCVCGGELIIGNDVMMGPECVFFSRQHKFDNPDVPMCLQGFTDPKPIVIGDDVWIGRRVMVMPGVHIGSHCIIGAGAIVTKDIPDWAIAAGSPAVVKKYRNMSSNVNSNI